MVYRHVKTIREEKSEKKLLFVPKFLGAYLTTHVQVSGRSEKPTEVTDNPTKES